ncbi:MAG: hypothetical protein WA130_10975 [Candidatus Methanoperedens sp.]
MDETEYKELLEYLKEQLEKKGAIDVVNQIKEVAASKVTVDVEVQKKVEDIPEIFKEITDTISKSKKLKSDYKDIGKTRLRNLTNKEIFSEAIKILINYLQTLPKMTNRISVLLKIDSEKIRWKFDTEDISNKKQIDFLSIMLEVTQEETKINECLSILKTEVINTGSLNGHKSST